VADYRRLPGPRAEHWQWQARGACRGMQLSVFFHPTFERGENRRRRDAHAKAVCHRCPVLTACREHALRVAEPYGVWGGLSAEEREDLLATQHRTEAMPTTVSSNSRDAVPVG
jgi:WhiB family redox-sensing transcriptional regulator